MADASALPTDDALQPGQTGASLQSPLAEGEALCLAIVANLALDQLSAELFERRLPRHDLEGPFPPQDGDAPLRKVDTARINAFDG